MMNRSQRRFYESWLNAWRRGKGLDVEGQISYLFCYLYDVLEMPDRRRIHELGRIAEVYSSVDKVSTYCRTWLADCYFLHGDYRNAVRVFPPLVPNSRSSSGTDTLLTLKLLAGLPISGRDILTLYGPKVTTFGRKHIDNVVEYAEVLLRQHERERNVNLLKVWSSMADTAPFYVFGGSRSVRETKHRSYLFSLSNDIQEFTEKITREAENTVREELGVPRVGEGWVGETELYWRIKTELHDHEVVHHARPSWLSPQHLDIYIPELNVGVEYQGEQHEKPVEYFGGVEAYQEQKKRDQRKLRLCKKNGVRIV